MNANRYNKGKVYKIHCLEEGKNKIYIGCTIQTLCKRMSGHRKEFTRWKNGLTKDKLTSFILFDEYGPQHCVITLIENVQAISKEELLARERFYIDANECVNRKYIQPTEEEMSKRRERRKQYIKEYYENNKEEILQKNREYNLTKADKESLKKSREKWRKNNKDKTKKYYNEHKEDFNKRSYENSIKRKKFIDCECGGRYSNLHKSTHFKTKMHSEFLNKNTLVI
jgi:hypothetical protein